MSADELTRTLKWQLETAAHDWSTLIDALSRLPHQVRTAIVLKHFYGYDYKEIASTFKVPIGTVKSRVHNGLQTLRKEWMADEQGSSSQN